MRKVDFYKEHNIHLNTPARLVNALRRVNWNRRALGRERGVNIFYISQLLNKGIEPTNQTIRERLYLHHGACPKCQRTFRTPRANPAPRAVSPARAWWDKLKREDRDKLIELSYKNFMDWKQRR